MRWSKNRVEEYFEDVCRAVGVPTHKWCRDNGIDVPHFRLDRYAHDDDRAWKLEYVRRPVGGRSRIFPYGDNSRVRAAELIAFLDGWAFNGSKLWEERTNPPWYKDNDLKPRIENPREIGDAPVN